MGKRKEIIPAQFKTDPYRIISEDWFLLTAEQDGKINSMTGGWGGFGTMFRKNVVFIAVRESRYTKELIDGSDTFSMSFLDHKKYQSTLGYMGTFSGRDHDKIKESGLTVVRDEDGVPYFDEASMVITCRKLTATPLPPEQFFDPEIDRRFYQDKDYHTLYFGEVLRILK